MSANWKTVRVFISSTFRDMQAERDHLVRFVFPRLRRKQSDCGEIVAVGESDESRRFVGEIKALEEHLKLISSDPRLFWITDALSVGKSAFAAHLAHYGRDKVIAVQFCEWDEPVHRKALHIVRSLAFQLTTNNLGKHAAGVTGQRVVLSPENNCTHR